MTIACIFKKWIAPVLAIVVGLLPSLAAAGSFEVFVGYADNLRASPFFPSPFFGDANTALFVGQDPSSVSLDSGAVRIFNNGPTDITLNGLTANVPGNGWNDPNWNSYFPGGVVLHPGKNAIFVQTGQYNFDTSDEGYVPVNTANNCSIGAEASSTTCISNAPFVRPTVDGTAYVLRDTGHVLDTGGFDFVNSNPCSVVGDSPGGCNESLQWRLIGTTGIQDPSGSLPVPEPETYAMLVVGVGLLGWFARRGKMVAGSNQTLQLT